MMGPWDNPNPPDYWDAPEPSDEDYQYSMTCCGADVLFDEVDGDVMDCPVCGAEEQVVNRYLPEQELYEVSTDERVCPLFYDGTGEL